jgi:pimeloyl-ACP methyl ester carboxylesterase
MKFLSPQGVFFQYDKTRSGWIKVVEVFLTAIIFLLVLGVILEFAFGRVDKSKFKVKGTMIKIQKHRILTNVTGQGTVTVVFDSDINSPMQQWGKVRDSISNEVKVFTYERAGYGWSESASDDYNMDQAVKDLRTALKRSSAVSPFILVGHGYGGLVMSKFAKEYPNEVVGVILIDSLTEKELGTEEFKKELNNDIKKVKLMKYGSYIGITRLLDRLNVLKVDQNLFNNMPNENKELYRAMRVTTKQNDAVYNELMMLSKYENNVQAPGLLGDKSLLVITTTKDIPNESLRNAKIGYGKDLVQMSSKSEQLIIQDSSTYVQLEKPEVIISGIKTILKRYQK